MVSDRAGTSSNCNLLCGRGVINTLNLDQASAGVSDVAGALVAQVTSPKASISISFPKIYGVCDRTRIVSGYQVARCEESRFVQSRGFALLVESPRTPMLHRTFAIRDFKSRRRILT